MDRDTLLRRQKQAKYIEDKIDKASAKLSKAPRFRGQCSIIDLLCTARNHVNALRENLRVDAASLD